MPVEPARLHTAMPVAKSDTDGAFWERYEKLGGGSHEAALR